jgi:hypothetical protein
MHVPVTDTVSEEVLSRCELHKLQIKSCACMQLWEEVLYRDEMPPQIVARSRTLNAHLDALMEEELQYDVGNLPDNVRDLGLQRGYKQHSGKLLAIQNGKHVCPAMEHTPGKPMDARRKILFIIGAQKGGTTYVFNSLVKHSSFVGAEHAYGCAFVDMNRISLK